jgi:diacylglycerol kinase (ATP)
MDPQPRVGIIPLGTGNDTSRHFGWGHKLRSERTVVQYIRNMQQVNCPFTPLDRWQLIINIPREKREFMHPFLRSMPEISPEAYADKASLLHAQHINPADAPSVTHNVTTTASNKGTDRGSVDSQTSISPTTATASDKDTPDEIHLLWSFNNYFSFGIDAQIMDSFHHHRERFPGCYCCRCCTMTWIGLWSPINCCSCNKLPLRMDVDLLMPKSTDGTDPAVGDFEWVPSQLDAEALDAFILLNLPTYAGGRNIWGADQGKSSDLVTATTTPSTSDGKLEVLGFSSYTHMSTAVALQTTRAQRLQQVIGARFRIRDNMFVQLDGEAWTQDCGSIEILRGPSVDVMLNEPADAQGACCDC